MNGNVFGNKTSHSRQALISRSYIEDITRLREDMDFMFEWPHKIHIFELPCNVLFIICS